MRPPSGSGRPRPGSTSTNMSFRAVFGRSSAVASRRIRFSYSRSISSRTPALWPPPRRHRLCVRELNLDPLGRVLDEREAEVLLAQDVHGHGEAEDEEADHREEVHEVLA